MDLNALKEAVINGDLKGCTILTEVAIQAGYAPQKVLTEALVPAMEVVGEKFRCNEVYVPEVLVAARAMKKSLSLLKPLLIQTGAKPVGVAVAGTVKGDLHDIGKNLVCMMWEGAGFEVVDLGADVTPDKFVQAVKDTSAQIVGISTLLTTTMLGMRDVIQALERAQLREKVKVMVGGAPVTQAYANEIGADAYGESAAVAVEKAKALLGVG
ncbi:MAG: methyltransferase [candidate division NC10 bacterium RIFCSPLOWO2_02_FULL_66_22]|nr:MAG: methyltransferase [candidate division NC10 bacterium RIFCSPLOWO2_02_FULL_66_22]